jgi:hypothetical protein
MRLYQNLVQSELSGRRRLIALNQCGRYYLLALTAQMRCLVLCNDLLGAQQRLEEEKPISSALAKVMFEDVLGKSPEVYLDPNLQGDQITLDLLAEIFHQGQQLEVVSGPAYRSAGHLFEQLRSRIYGASSWFRPVRSRRGARDFPDS